MGGFCNSCMSRVPYATLIATIMCCLGVVIFCMTMYKGATLTSVMLDQVFHSRLTWLDAVQLGVSSIGAGMAALGFMILCLGCFTTGATRHKVYKAWRTRVGGRISCAVFMAITYILVFIWLAMFAFLIIVTWLFVIFSGLCSNPRVQNYEQCIDLTQYSFLFPENTRIEDMQICEQEVKHMCGDYINHTEKLFIIATVASFLIILSLIHYLMCLAANYAHIRDHEKFQELQELQYLQDPHLIDSESPTMSHDRAHHRSKDRF